MSSPDNLSREQLLSLIYNNTNDLIFVIGVETDGAYRVVSVNKSYLESTGRTAGDLIDLPVSQAIAPEQYAYVKSRYDEAVARGAPYHYETRVSLESGTKYLDTTLVPIFSGERCIYLIGVSRDITQSKLEQKALRSEKERAENYLDISEALIVALDRNANITMINRKGYKILGYPEGSLTGASWCDLCLDSSKHEQFRAGYQEIIESGHIDSNVNYIRNKQGDKRLVSWANAIIRDERGSVAGVLSSGEDITDRRNAEKAMIASQRQMAAGEVVSAVAHDFNNSLQGILGNIEIVLADRTLSEESVQRLSTAAGLAEDAAKRIQTLRRFVDSNTEMQREPLDVNGLIDEVVDQTEHLWRTGANLGGREIMLEREYGPGTLWTEGSRSDLRSVLYNVVKNSIEAMRQSGSIRFETKGDDDFVSITILDTGVGMTEDTRHRIFQPFFSTKGMETGRGLGMSASQSIVQAHGGTISVLQTEPGVGTTIEIVLPRTFDVRESGESSSGVSETLRHNILWVDDDPDVRNLAEKYIEVLGHSGDVVDSGESALSHLEQTEYSVVLTDIGMPGMSGVELADRIYETGKGIPVIALTGWGESMFPSGEEKPGIAQVLAKPIRLDDLRVALASLQG